MSLTINIIFISCNSDLKNEFSLSELTIAKIHNEYKKGDLTAKQLTEYYLKRIEKLDKSSGLNSIVVVNPKAISRAEELDTQFKKTGQLLPLHGIPIIVKDNYDTFDMQTTGGSIAMKGSIPPDDAYQVRKLREAGAIILAKSNMAEWAFSPYVTESSIAGITRNPYDLDRVPAGSSGGTAAAVAANFGVIGLGTDTGNSIRGPSSHNCLVGIRSTMGLTSRDGIIPLYLRNDIGGPMGRTVEDAVRILQVIAGFDPADPITELSKTQKQDDYLQFLDYDGLKGVKIGVFRKYIDDRDSDPEYMELMERAIEELKNAGAIIIDPFQIPDFEKLTENIWRDVFKQDVNNYLATLGEDAPYKKIEDIYESGKYSSYIADRLKAAVDVQSIPMDSGSSYLDLYRAPQNMAFRNAVLEAMKHAGIDIIVYPTWSNFPRKVGDMENPAGDNSQILSPQTGFPAITVPIGCSHSGLPAGMTFVGRLFSEPELIKCAYAYEQATKYRIAPQGFLK